MKMQSVKILQQFIGKICTVMTVPINRNFQSENEKTYPEVVYNYFLGRIESVDDDGVLMSQLGGEPPLQSYFFLPHIVSIAQEKEYREENPQDAEMIQQLKQQVDTQMEEHKKAMAAQKEDSGSEIDPESLMEITNQLKKQYGPSNE